MLTPEAMCKGMYDAVYALKTPHVMPCCNKTSTTPKDVMPREYPTCGCVSCEQDVGSSSCRSWQGCCEDTARSQADWTTLRYAHELQGQSSND